MSFGSEYPFSILDAFSLRLNSVSMAPFYHSARWRNISLRFFAEIA
jgi:hypothetical protein